MLALSDTVMVAAISGAAVVLAALIAALSQTTRRAIRHEFRPISKALDVGNERTLAEYVHDTAGTVEVVQTQQRAVAADVLEMHTKVERIESTVDRIDGHVDRVDSKLDRHLTEVGEGSGALAAWVRKKIQEENGVD